jgi:hypothetical protein
MNSLQASEVQTAYTTAPKVQLSEHYTGVRLLGPIITVYGSFRDPLSFSRERWLQGEADAEAGRVHSFDDVMNALRAQVRKHSV